LERTHDRIGSTSFWPTLTLWKFIPKMAGTCPATGEVVAPDDCRPSISLRMASTLIWSYESVLSTELVMAAPGRGKVTVLPRVSSRVAGMMSALISGVKRSSTAVGVPWPLTIW